MMDCITMPCTRTGIPLRSIPAGEGHVRERKKRMTDEDKVVSLKFVAENGSAVDYVMIEGEDVELAKAVATRWAE